VPVSENDGKLSPQPEVRSSHNIVEKRYRMSINDKLGELRELVDGRDSKVQYVHVLCLSASMCQSVCLGINAFSCAQNKAALFSLLCDRPSVSK